MITSAAELLGVLQDPNERREVAIQIKRPLADLLDAAFGG